MSEMEEKLGAILNNPQMMQQIMAMAQAMNQGQSQEPPKKTPPGPQASENPVPLPAMDPGIMKSLAGIAQGGSVDQNQRTLLNALCPYLSQNRVSKLEKAMRAAKMAGLASSFLDAGGLRLLAGR